MSDLITAAVSWLWGRFAKDLTEKATKELSKRWEEFQWTKAEIHYRERLHEQYGYTRLLGNPKRIEIENLFTDVYVLDKPTAYHRFDLNKLQKKPLKRKDLKIEVRRKPALQLAVEESRLFILGKPGAGKTTFLKYLTLQACEGKIAKTPIFVSLKEWADSGLELMPFLQLLFEICNFPDASMFIENLLKHGDALVLFDGLDEVNAESGQRAKLIPTLTQFAQRYPRTQICITCRVAANEYSFTAFTYIEIADFDSYQIELFAKKWYLDEPQKYIRFLKEFRKPEHEGLRELAQTPLLLTLLCLGFDETLAFPERRVDLYREALDALLKKWDNSRGIRRDEIYRKLSPGRKEQMLARVAAQNFEKSIYFIRKSELVRQLTNYLQKLPDVEFAELSDGEIVLHAVEAQHGILTERAHDIYSFSHLTFQEYYTSRYIVDNAESGSIKALVHYHMSDVRWREVFLLTASLLDNADTFFEYFLNAISDWTELNTLPLSWLKWAKKISDQQNKYRTVTVRSILLMVRLMQSCNNAFGQIEELERAKNFATMQHPRDLVRNQTRNLERAQGHANKLEKTLEHARKLTRAINRDKDLEIHLGSDYKEDRSEALWANLAILALSQNNNKHRYDYQIHDITISLGLENITQNPKHKHGISDNEVQGLLKYLEMNQLLIDCLKLSAVTDRQTIEDKLLLLTGEKLSSQE